MSFTIHDLKKHLVDLRRSDWDKEKSDPKKGKYVFKKKIYVKRDDYRDTASRPDYVFKWVGFREEDPRSGYYLWQMKWDASPVVAGEDPFWPEPLKPDASGHYSVMDALLVKIPLDVYMAKVKDDRELSERTVASSKKRFQAEAAKDGAFTKGDDDLF